MESVTELNAFYPKRVQSSYGTPAPFSKRVKLLIEHPVFNRLSSVPQLGILVNTYPTASHNRLEHSIGAFRNCCLYIQALYNDHYNPLFRQVIKEEDIKCIMVTGLLHDLGQYPLAHEIEEINHDFKHEKLSVEFLENDTKNPDGFTIKDIVENKDWGWGIKTERIVEILEEKNQMPLFQSNFKLKLLKSIIDGPIDADKLDYLIRDSQKCYLRYGDLIDFDRLVKNLTIITTHDDCNKFSLKIGVYEKGQSAAESIIFARYLLYQSLYWHRTARSVRAMLKYVFNNCLAKKSKGKVKTFYDELKILIGVSSYPSKISIFDVLSLIEKWSNAEGKKMIKMINERRYYKRIVTIHDDEPRKGKDTFVESFRKAHNKKGFNALLCKTLIEVFLETTKNAITQNTYTNTDSIDKTLSLLQTPNAILTDCPEPSYGGKDVLSIIPEPQRLYKNYFSRVKTGEKVSTVWNEIYFKLMNVAAKGRIFCHPDVRNTLMATVGLEGLKIAVKKQSKNIHRSYIPHDSPWQNK